MQPLEASNGTCEALGRPPYSPPPPPPLEPAPCTTTRRRRGPWRLSRPHQATPSHGRTRLRRGPRRPTNEAARVLFTSGPALKGGPPSPQPKHCDQLAPRC